jgi:hypothetical protein
MDERPSKRATTLAPSLGLVHLTPLPSFGRRGREAITRFLSRSRAPADDSASIARADSRTWRKPKARAGAISQAETEAIAQAEAIKRRDCEPRRKADAT